MKAFGHHLTVNTVFRATPCHAISIQVMHILTPAGRKAPQTTRPPFGIVRVWYEDTVSTSRRLSTTTAFRYANLSIITMSLSFSSRGTEVRSSSRRWDWIPWWILSCLMMYSRTADTASCPATKRPLVLSVQCKGKGLIH